MSADRAGRPSLRPRLRRLVTTAAVVLFSLYALYLVALNIFLSSSLFEKVIDQDPETILITYERGWTVWPGTIHARRLSVRSSDSQVQFMLRVETCEFDVSLVDLVRKQFHVTRVVAAGVTFDARRRIDGPSATPEVLDALPVIPGFERIPFRLPGPPDDKERWDDRYYHLWTVHLEDVTASDVRRIWVDGERFEGDARVTGTFYLKPIRVVEAGPVHVDIFAGTVRLEQRVVAETLTGTVDARLRPFDPRSAETAALLHHISVATELRGRSPDLANFPRELTAPVRASGPAEVRRLALRIEDGRLEKDTHLDLVALGASVEVARHRFAGDLELVAEVPNDAYESKLTFRVAARSIAVRRVVDGDVPLLMVAPVVELTGDARSLDLGNLLSDLHVVALVPHVDLHDGRALDPHVPEGTAVGFGGAPARGQGRIEAWFADRRLKLEAHLEADDVDVALAEARLRGSAKVEGSVDAWRWEAERLEGVQVKLHVANGSLASMLAPHEHLLEVGAFDVAADAAEVAQGDPTRAFHATIHVKGVEVVDRSVLARCLPRSRKLQLVTGRARFEARSELEVDDHVARGTLDLHAARLDVRLGRLDLRAALQVRARVHDWAWERGDLAIDEAKAVLTDVIGTTEAGRAPALTVARVAVEVSSKRFSLSDPLADVDLRGSVAGATLTDPAALDAFLPAGSSVLFDARENGARLDATLAFGVRRHVARGSVVARSRGLGARGKTVRVLGDVEAAAEVESWRLEEGTMRLPSARVTIHDAAVRLGAEGARGSAVAEASPDIHAKRIELHAKAEELDVAHPSLDDVDYHLTLDDARMDDLGRLGALLPAAGTFVLEAGRARGDVDLAVTRSEGKATGSARLVLEEASLRRYGSRFAGSASIVAKVKGFDGDRGALDVSGSSLTLRDVSVAGDSAEVSGWSADLQLLQGALRISERPAFDAFAQLHADDAKPLLAILVGGASLPKLLVGPLAAKGLSGQGRITLHPEWAAILDGRLGGDDVVAFGDYVVAGEHVRGAAIVAKGPLSAGVRVDDHGTHLRLFGLEGWLDKEKRDARALLHDAQANARARAADAVGKTAVSAKERSASH